LLDNLCDRDHANLFIDFATSQVPDDYVTVVLGPAIDLGMVVRTHTEGLYTDASSLNDAVVKVFDNTITYYKRKAVQDPQQLALHARSLRKWWVDGFQRIMEQGATNVSYNTHYSTIYRTRQAQARSQIDSARATSQAALQVVAHKKTTLNVEDADLDEIETQNEILMERELLHAERVLNKNIATSAYLRCGPFEQFDSSVLRHDIGSMTVVCEKCYALRFQCERPNFCCNDGKIDLPRRKAPPPVLRELMEDQSQRG
jgi:hypothetical protein